MTFVYVSERERWRSTMLLLWKRGPLQKDIGPLSGKSPIIKLICEYGSPPWPTQPLRKLTMNLINTYTGINETYYAAKSKYTAAHPVGSTNGNFVWGNRKSLVLNNRYELFEQIGSGAFGVVMGALDLQTKEHVAIKMIKAKRAYSQQARREIGLLQDLRAKDVEGSSNVVELRGHFVYNNPGVGNHECLVFEKLNSNLYTLLESTGFNGFSLIVIRKFCEQLLKSLAFLARPGVRVIHTDIKPENICIRYPRRSALKLIDFGSSCNEGHQLFSYIQSRYYRSPEVLLGFGYTVAIDIWSLACVLSEMHTGTPLFSGDNMVDQIRKIMCYNGLPPDKMIEKFKPEDKRNQLFMENPFYENNQSQNKQKEDDAPSSSSIPIKNPINEKEIQNNEKEESNEGSSANDENKTKSESNNPQRKWLAKDSSLIGNKSLSNVLNHGKWKGDVGNTEADIEQFKDLLTKMLIYDPLKRITPSEALLHPFVTQEYKGSVRDMEKVENKTRSNLSHNSSSSSSSSSSGVTTRASTSLSSSTSTSNMTTRSSNNESPWVSYSPEFTKVLLELGIPNAKVEKILQLQQPPSNIGSNIGIEEGKVMNQILKEYTNLNEETLHDINTKYLAFVNHRTLHQSATSSFRALLSIFKEAHSTSSSSSSSSRKPKAQSTNGDAVKQVMESNEMMLSTDDTSNTPIP